MNRWIGIAVVVAVGTVACGGSGAESPSAPSPSGNLVVASASMSGSASSKPGAAVEVEGRVESLVPADPGGTLIVDGRSVTATAQTAIWKGGTACVFADLAIGQRVHVKGTLSEGVITAGSIAIQNTNTWVPVNVNGIITALSVTSPDFVATIDGREVRGDSTTVFYGDDDVVLTLAALAVGVRVEVKGRQDDGYVFAERIHVNGAAATEPPQEESASIEGRLNAIGGSVPALTLTIGTTTVTTTAATEVQRRGDVQTLDDLAVGQTIHAVGTRLADGSLVARKLQIKNDEPEGAFAVSGPMGGLKGTCPALTFGVNGYAVYTTDATVFGPDALTCASFKSGTKVEVKGQVGADGRAMAASVTKQ